MGTRHLTLVALDGKYKVAQYGQWDGYPSGQGVTALKFCRDMDRAAFTEKVRAAQFLTDKDIEELNARIESEKIQDWSKKWPWLSRDAGAEILKMVMDHEPGIKLQDRTDFAADSLFCEWAYVIDLDAGTLEVFKGYNQTPLAEGERFFGVTSSDPVGQGYEPVKHLHTFKLDALPSKEEFLSILEPDDDEEDEADED